MKSFQAIFSDDFILRFNDSKLQFSLTGGFNTAVTLLGRTMGQLPVSPRYSKMILLAHQQNCIQYMIIIVAALTVKVCHFIVAYLVRFLKRPQI